LAADEVRRQLADHQCRSHWRLTKSAGNWLTINAAAIGG